MKSLYLLCEYEIPIPSVQRLKKAGITFEEILLNREKCLNKIYGKNAKTAKKLLKIVDNIAKRNLVHTSIFELCEYGISHNICNRLHNRGATIENLVFLDNHDYEEKYNCKTSMSQKIRTAIQKYKEAANNKEPAYIDLSYYLSNTIKEIAYDKSISYIALKGYLLQNTKYPVDNLSKELEDLKNKNIIELTSEGLKYKILSLNEATEKYIKSKHVDVFLERLNGKTLEQIGQERGLTRERIRQIIRTSISNLPDVKENEYKLIFEEFYWTEETFCAYTKSTRQTYYYLKEITKTGDKNISELYNQEINKEQELILDKLNKFLNYNGRRIKANKIELIKCITENYAKEEISISELFTIYNETVKKHFEKYDLGIDNLRSFEGILLRSGCVISGIKKKIRYYNFDNITENDIKNVKKLLDLDSGYYSTYLLFINNNEYMKEINILNEYELHNFLKIIIGTSENGIIFTRMPGLLIGYIDKKEFFNDKAIELSPISIKDFVSILQEDFGHKEFIYSEILNLFQEYITNGKIQLTQIIMNNTEIELLKTKMVKDIYSIDDVKEIFKENSIDDETINSYNMSNIGYKLRSNYIIKNGITSIDLYIKDLTETRNFLKTNEAYFKTSTFYLTLSSFEKTYDLMKVSDDEYITYKKLNEIGITKLYLVEIANKIKKEFNDNDYFTSSNIRKEVDIDFIDDFGFEDIFYENFISNIDGISYFRINDQKVFSFIHKSRSVAHFIENVVNKTGAITIDRFILYLQETYELYVDIYKLKISILESNLYYNDILEKIYLDKKDYYEEVFTNE